ncbi:hypothetical protein G5C60_44210 [Streptomyces sp. HC44]|uniref:ABM domain-containing protein n=1 Tax=Streptomyces scabichelini TaxID=2711217 RepID=A0A6G4VKC4_9ACTN|nr:hypothetical protein [Streptomyces scabichelini]NGO14421.1 hypothetical protein [Streptomyces scabichelini]
MAIIAVFDTPGMTQAQYEEGASRVNQGRGLPKVSSDWPVPGLVAHIAGPSQNGWFVADVWESEEAFNQFGQIILPILRDLGFGDVQPKIVPAFNVVTD